MSSYTHDGYLMELTVKYSQLSSCRVHTCLSMGYLVRSMLQAIVAVMLLGIQSRHSLPSFKNPTEITAALLIYNRGC